MARHSAIEWTDATWNPWRGCSMVSPGCARCYMFRDMRRWGLDPEVVVRSSLSSFLHPLSWHRSATQGGLFVFTCSFSDFFHPHADAWRLEAWDVIRQTPGLTYLVLTKRPELVAARLPPGWPAGFEHVWLGVSVELQAYVWRIETILEVPAAIHFVSAEPLLGPLNLDPFLVGSPRIDWVIAGGESDPSERGPRWCAPEWLRSLRDDCRATRVPFFLKQLGGRTRSDGSWGGRLLDGRSHSERPSARTQGGAS